jgi:uncharacterized membrane protein
MATCAKCGAQLSEGATFCGSCGTPVSGAAAGAPAAAGSSAAPPAAAPTSSGLTSNVAGALAYVTIIPAILFLVMEPYNKDKFIRFHSFQCLFLTAVLIAASIVFSVLSFILALIPVVGAIVGFLLWMVLMVGLFIVWVLCIYKAYQNKRWELPVIGKLAAQQAG